MGKKQQPFVIAMRFANGIVLVIDGIVRRRSPELRDTTRSIQIDGENTRVGIGRYIATCWWNPQGTVTERIWIFVLRH